MPHFKCDTCRARLYSAADRDDLFGELCPGCGSLLEPVGDVAEIVGYRSIKSRDDAAEDGPPDAHQRIANRVDDFVARRGARLAQERLDAERWIDDGGSFSPEAVAAAMALRAPEENP